MSHHYEEDEILPVHPDEPRTTSNSPSGENEETKDDTHGGIFSPAFKEKLRQLLAARDDYAEKDAAAKAAKKVLDEIELDVYDVFNGIEDDPESGLKGTIPVPLGPPYGTVKFRTRATHYHKITDPEALQEYFEQRAMVDETSAPQFVKARLNEIVRETLENPDGKLPPGLSYYTNRGMTITRQK